MAVSFEDLLAWQKAHELMLLVHQQVVPLLPPSERRNLVDQLRRSSKSTPANIAEGHGKFYFKETIRYCYTARGSLSETENHLIAAKDLRYISEPLYQQARQLSGECQRLLNGYISYLKRTQPGKNEPGCDFTPDKPSSEPNPPATNDNLP